MILAFTVVNFILANIVGDFTRSLGEVTLQAPLFLPSSSPFRLLFLLLFPLLHLLLHLLLLFRRL